MRVIFFLYIFFFGPPPPLRKQQTSSIWVFKHACGSLKGIRSGEGVKTNFMCEWVRSHVWMSHVPRTNESCLVCEWVMSRMWMSHVSYVNESSLICEWVMSHMWVSHVSHVNASSRMHTWNADQSESDQEDAVKTNLMTSATSLENLLSTGFFWCVPFSLTHMGWLRLVGSLRLWVSFTKEPYKADDSLQKRPIIFRSLLIIAWKSTFDRFFLTCSFQFDT